MTSSSSSLQFTTDDGVSLNYWECGNSHSVQKLIFLPGWSLSSEVLFQYQLPAFATPHKHVIALNPRGHGRQSSSSSVSSLRLARLAKDLHLFLQHLTHTTVVLDHDDNDNNSNNNDSNQVSITLVCHSASCVVYWQYLELFYLEYLQQSNVTHYRLECVVLMDQMICYLPRENESTTSWTTDDYKQYGVAMTNAQDAYDVVQNVRHDTDGSFTKSLLQTWVHDQTPKCLLSKDEIDTLWKGMMQMSRSAAASLLWQVMTSDFGPFLESLSNYPYVSNLPATLCIGSVDSHIPCECLSFMASLIPNAEYEILQKGGHLVCYEDPEAFNTILEDFLQRNEAKRQHHEQPPPPPPMPVPRAIPKTPKTELPLSPMTPHTRNPDPHRATSPNSTTTHPSTTTQTQVEHHRVVSSSYSLVPDDVLM